MIGKTNTNNGNTKTGTIYNATIISDINTALNLGLVATTTIASSITIGMYTRDVASVPVNSVFTVNNIRYSCNIEASMYFVYKKPITIQDEYYSYNIDYYTYKTQLESLLSTHLAKASIDNVKFRVGGYTRTNNYLNIYGSINNGITIIEKIEKEEEISKSTSKAVNEYIYLNYDIEVL